VLLDGKGFGDHLLVTALGIDEQGRMRVLGIRDGGREDQAVCSALLQDLMDRGLCRCRTSSGRELLLLV